MWGIDCRVRTLSRDYQSVVEGHGSYRWGGIIRYSGINTSILRCCVSGGGDGSTVVLQVVGDKTMARVKLKLPHVQQFSAADTASRSSSSLAQRKPWRRSTTRNQSRVIHELKVALSLCEKVGAGQRREDMYS